MTLADIDDQDADDNGPGKTSGKRQSLMDRLFQWRDRLLAHPRFQRAASGFFLTRPFANKHANALFDICAGFVYSQVLTACIRIDLFDSLREGPQTSEALARQTNIPVDAMQRLLMAADSLGLVRKRSGGRYGLGVLGAAVTGNPTIAAMVEHHAMLYEDLRDPLALLRGEIPETQLAGFLPYAAGENVKNVNKNSVSGYTALMAASQGMIAEDVLAAHDFSRHRHLLDIGGGDGSFLIAAAKNAPSLRLTLFDLPPVAEIAQQRIKDEGLENRATVAGGSFLADRLPEGADLITLIRVLFDHDDATVLKILQAARRAIRPEGVLAIAETISGLTGSAPVSDAYFNLYLLAMGKGRSRSFDELKALLTQAGFHRIKAKSTRRPLLANLIIALPKSGTH